MKLSVVVPTLNEGAQVEGCLRAIRGGVPPQSEVLIVDGGSQDDTVLKAAAMGERILSRDGGLARQCNSAVEVARGEWLFFVAADTRPPREWGEAFGTVSENPHVSAAGFHLAIDDKASVYRWLAWGGSFRSRYCRIALPDQGLFVRRSDYLAVGGMNPESRIPYARLCLDLRRRGEFVLFPQAMLSSARKWRENGVARTTWGHMRAFLAFSVVASRTGIEEAETKGEAISCRSTDTT